MTAIEALTGPLVWILGALATVAGAWLAGRRKGRKAADQRNTARAAEQEAARHDRITEAETDGPVTDDDVLDRLRSAEGRIRGHRD